MTALNRLRLAIGQLNPTVGDVAGNLALARRARAEAAAAGADLLVLTELFIAGYPPEDLVLKPAFRAACRTAVEALAADTADGGPGVLIGTPWESEAGVHNAAALLDRGKVEGIRFKVELPNYGVFDEVRVFAPGRPSGPLAFRGVRLGIAICEDIWAEQVPECLAETGSELILVPNGSPYWRGKADERMQVAVARVVETGLPIVYANQVGGQDELVFDGASFALHGDRTLAVQLPQFEAGVTVAEWRREATGWRVADGPVAPLPQSEEADWWACVLGLRDYVAKNGFPGVVLGLSGGVDSAVVAVMAVDALGAAKVHAVMLPSEFTSAISLEDASALAARLGIRYDTIGISGAVASVNAALAPIFAGRPPDVTEENIQSRLRGALLMALSNKLGGMVLTTGNKSEMSVGYATLYGDMNGGFNPVKDLYKTEVYRLAAWRNAHRPDGLLGSSGPVIPERILTRAPSAELRPNQTDQDSLPPYAELDAILEAMVEQERGVADIVAAGHTPETVRRVERLLNLAEYKRRQAAPGVKITRKSFGRDRRYPITNRFREGSG
ncbi:MAG: NAD+ synthase [Bauldia sp.]